MERILSAKATYICYEIESKIKCNYCNATDSAGHTGIDFDMEIPIIRERINVYYGIQEFKEMSTEDIVNKIIDNIEQYILRTYIYKKEVEK